MVRDARASPASSSAVPPAAASICQKGRGVDLPSRPGSLGLSASVRGDVAEYEVVTLETM